ncbi:MAG: hypothetical protein HZC12_00315 [Nitrospirae bacterium]|nr:hypothetical protein [Nitrospirota bacterium]
MEEDSLNKILQHLKAKRSLDFSAYKIDTLKRRIEQRFPLTQTTSYKDYFDYLQSRDKEIDALIESITIKVSHVFRGPIVFDVLDSFILPHVIKQGGAVRVWCAIEKAQSGVYSDKVIQEVKKKYLDKYFTKKGQDYEVADEIKAIVDFGYHDLVHGGSPAHGIFADYNIILCRNVLIYFQLELQERVIKNFARILKPEGILVLGEAESISLSCAEDFEDAFPETKIYKKRHVEGSNWMS